MPRLERERYQRVMVLAADSERLPEPERSAFLLKLLADDPSIHAEVVSILRYADSPASLLLTPAVPARDHDRDALDDWTPATIGGFVITRRIGRGGAGVVFAARQRDPERDIAIKVLRPGLFSAEQSRRFRTEAAALARLEHPGIARVYCTGQDREGALYYPFIAMEHIDGPPITRYAEMSELDLRGRIDLVLQICDAVEYAHRRGIIHRDLKPSNILVDQAGHPRVLDFGLALALDAPDEIDRTVHGLVLGTPPYLSPEQAAGLGFQADTRSDVYSLGVLLFELLSGRRPLDVAGLSTAQAVHLVRTTDPLRLSAISRRFRGDLDAITSMAMARDPERRYQSVGELAADLRRHIASRPVLARHAGPVYHVSRFIRRRAQLTATLVAVALALVAGLTWHTVHAQRLIEASIRTMAGMTWLSEASTTDPVTAARRFATLERNIIDHAGGHAALRGAAWLLAARECTRTADLRRDWALECYDRAQRLLSESLGDSHPLTVQCRYSLASELLINGQYDAAEQTVATALAGARELGDIRHLQEALLQSAYIKLQRGRCAEAEALFAEFESIVTEGTQPEHFWAQTIRADILASRGEYGAAIEIRRRIAIERPVTMDRMAMANFIALSRMELWINGDLRTADRWLARAEAAADWVRDRRGIEWTRQIRAGLCWAAGDFERAHELFSAQYAAASASLPERDLSVIDSLNGIAVTLRDSGRVEQAVPLLRRVLQLRKTVAGADSVPAAGSMVNLAKALLGVGESGEALQLSAAAFIIRRDALGLNSQEAMEAEAVWRLAQARTGHRGPALAGIADLLKRRSCLSLVGQWNTDYAVEALIAILGDAGLEGAAAAAARADLEASHRLLGPQNMVTLRAARRCAAVH